MTEHRLCAGITRSGERCTQSVREGLTYCHHDPDRAEQRSLAASRAAKAKAGELSEVKATLKRLAEDVVSGRLEKGRASVAFQGYGVLLRALELERRIKETEELEERIEQLEQAQKQRREYGWHA